MGNQKGNLKTAYSFGKIRQWKGITLQKNKKLKKGVYQASSLNTLFQRFVSSFSKKVTEYRLPQIPVQPSEAAHLGRLNY